MDLVGEAAESAEQKKAGMFDSTKSPTPVPVDEASDETLEKSELPGVAATRRRRDMLKNQINVESYTPAELTITPSEKEAFTDAVITGGRYTERFSLFGGKVVVTFRSRTTRETQAMYAYMRHMLAHDENASGILEGDMQYMTLAAQVEEINGTKYPELKKPFEFTESEGKVSEPGWMADMEAWKEKPESLTAALIGRLQLFEYKYWTMVNAAADKNFWNPDTSTAV